MTTKGSQERLEEIAALIKGGARAETFKKELDQLLDTVLVERDEQIEKAWESSYRGKDA